MRRKRLVASSGVIASAVLAACLHLTTFSTIEQAAVVVSPPSLDFGEVTVGTTSKVLTITFSPASGSLSSDDTITGLDVPCQDFEVTGPIPADVFRHCGTITPSQGELKPGDPDAPSGSAAPTCNESEVRTAEYRVTFHPTDDGPASCTLTFTGTFGTMFVPLSGKAVLPPHAIAVTPASVAIGDVRLGETSRLVPIKVENAGSEPLAISSIAMNKVGTVFALLGDQGSHALPAGDAETLEVTCTPSAEDTFDTTVIITSNADNAPVVNVPVSCRGIDSALSVTPASPVDFDTRHGDPLERDLTITNEGTASSAIDKLEVLGAELELVSSPALPFQLAPGGSRTLRVRYIAETLKPEKDALGAVEITHDGGKLDRIAISGQAVATSFGANPDGVDFGGVCAGTMQTQSIAVFANAPGGFEIRAFVPPAPPFTFTGDTGALDGDHANELAFTAAVAPTAPGDFVGTVTLATDIPGQPMRELSLRAQGLPEGVSATRSDFGTVPVGAPTTPLAVKVTNCGATSITDVATSLAGDAAGDFKILGQADLPTTVEPTATIAILVVMEPRAPGTRSAKLVISHSGGITEADLTGTAVGDAIDPGEDSYYTCSAGGGAAGWLVGLVVVGLVRRRRTSR